ncbi:hypothetical protein B0E42_20445 [Pseudomonas sp. A25(2017)]|nr:hypothetical protein B0E42_20445 [Pseudomonas sp. A25(2017)]
MTKLSSFHKLKIAIENHTIFKADVAHPIFNRDNGLRDGLAYFALSLVLAIKIDFLVNAKRTFFPRNGQDTRMLTLVLRLLDPATRQRAATLRFTASVQ